MKREGWQHGAARIGKATNALADHGKAPLKPTNHSKFTGKCRRARCGQCHSHPVSKSRDKAKGTYKLKSCDVALNHRLVSWRVVDDKGAHWSKYSGISATGILDNLSEEVSWGDSSDYHDQEIGDIVGCSDAKEDEENKSINDDDEEEEDGNMGFSEVGFVCEYIDGDDWCLVDEI